MLPLVTSMIRSNAIITLTSKLKMHYTCYLKK